MGCLCICFPESAKIHTLNGVEPIGALNKTKIIHSLNFKNGFSVQKDKFLTYLHYEPFASAEFIKITVENGFTLTISPDHFLFIKNSQISPPLLSVNSKSVKIGDYLIQVGQKLENQNFAKVVKMEYLTLRGVFAPLTKSGTLVVDGFLVSCYAHVSSHDLGHKSMGLLRFYHSNLKRNKNYGELEQGERKIEKDGIHKYAKLLMTLSSFIPSSQHFVN